MSTDTEDDELNEMLNFTPFSNDLSQTSLKKGVDFCTSKKGDVQEASEGIVTITPNKEKISFDAVKAKRLAENAYISKSLTKVTQLQWFKKSNKVYCPCRICEDDERVGLVINSRQYLIEGISLINSEKISRSVYKSRLVPIGDRWDPEKIQKLKKYYKKKDISDYEIEANFFFLDRVIEHVKEKEKEEKQNYLVEVEESSDDNLKQDEPLNESDDDSYDEPYTQNLEDDGIEDGIPIGNEKKTEPIRPGDVITYTCPIHVAGDKRGIRTASVKAVRPKEKTILILSNGEFLPSDTNIRRIKVMLRKKLTDHPFGVFRKITDFKLRKLGDANGSIIQGKIDEINEVTNRNLAELKKRIGEDGMKMLRTNVQSRAKSLQMNKAKNASKSSCAKVSTEDTSDSSECFNDKQSVKKNSYTSNKSISRKKKKVTRTPPKLDVVKKRKAKEKKVISIPASTRKKRKIVEDDDLVSLPDKPISRKKKKGTSTCASSRKQTRASEVKDLGNIFSKEESSDNSSDYTPRARKLELDLVRTPNNTRSTISYTPLSETNESVVLSEEEASSLISTIPPKSSSRTSKRIISINDTPLLHRKRNSMRFSKVNYYSTPSKGNNKKSKNAQKKKKGFSKVNNFSTQSKGKKKAQK